MTSTAARAAASGDARSRSARRGPGAGAARLVAAATLVVLLTALAGGLAAAAPDGSTADERSSTGADALELAERHAPVVMVTPQERECDPDGEPFAPMSVDLVLGNDDVTLRQAGAGDPVVTRAPTAADLVGRDAGFFLDLNGIAVAPGCTYERDFREYSAGAPPVVYAHVATQDDEPGRLALQFWLYWYFNDWNNTHESDWEFLQLLFEADTVAEALASEPVEVGVAQHEGGERSPWRGGALRLDGRRPVVHASRGSHATYFDRALYLGRSGTQGFGCDTTIGATRALRPEVVLLPDDPADAPPELAWIDFGGRWGERGSGPFDGPTGPATKLRWDRPIDWHEDLRTVSVDIPGGDETDARVLTTFCDVVERASNVARDAQVSPWTTVAVAAGALLVGRVLVRRTEWGAVPPTPLRRRRRFGQKLRAALASYVSSGGALLAVAAAYVPLAVVVGLVGWVAGFDVARTVASALTVAMALVVVALVAAYWELAGEGGGRPLAASIELVRDRLGSILLSLGLAAAVVAVLAMTVVGLPLAVRQIVRYQYVIPVAALEGRSGRAALRRSGELVEGRWWRTASTLLALVLLATLANAALQLGLLVLLDGVPLWAYVAVTFLVTGLVVPMVATAPVLLYGDAVAVEREVDDRADAERRPDDAERVRTPTTSDAG